MTPSAATLHPGTRKNSDAPSFFEVDAKQLFFCALSDVGDAPERHSVDEGAHVNESFSIALWPSREQWEAPMELPDDAEDERIFRATVAENLGTQTMTVVDDLWSV